MKTTIRRRLEKDLLVAVARLRHLARVVAVDELPGAIGDNSPGADEIDGSQILRASVATSLEVRAQLFALTSAE
jgi:hypothetical protein